MNTRRVRVFHFTTLAVIWSLACGSSGGGDACVGGAACTPANSCHAGVVSCSTGTPACSDTGSNVANGTACGVDQVCSGGQCVACAANLDCTPANPCHTGVTSCSTGSQACADAGTALANGTGCGADQVCNAGACVLCAANQTCTGQPDPLCHAGVTSCSTGTSVCVNGTALANGTGCGADQVCNAGACVLCAANQTCTTQPDPLCHAGVTSCSSGTSVCVNGTALANGTGCGADQVCNAGACVSCAANQTCTTQPDTLCHAGATSCSSGTSICVNGTALANGTTCGADQVCSGGQCVACTASAACTPANPCHAGVTSCATGSQTCVDTGTALGNGTTCGTDQVCSGGQCVACAANAPCTPVNPCHAGVTSCATGTQACLDTGSAVVDGTSCGATLVCRSGTCVQGPSPSAGCGNTGVATGYQTLGIQVDARLRSYDLLVPTTYDPTRPLALVFVFHGQGANSAAAAFMGLQNAPGAAADGIFVFPQGIDFPPYGVGWDESCSGYDMPFFDAMAQYIESTYCVDTNRVFATGFSWGADFTNNLGCCRGDKLRAVAPASGADGDYNPSSACVPKMPAFRITYGYLQSACGGAGGDGAYCQAAFDTVVNLYRSAHQCSTVSDAIPPPPCIAYRGCDAPVLECKYAGMGHDPPPSSPPNWATDVWSWLSSFQ